MLSNVLPGLNLGVRLGAVEQQYGAGTEAYIEAIAAVERQFLENSLACLSGFDPEAVGQAESRMGYLRGILKADTVEARLGLWVKIERIDEGYGKNGIFKKAVWVLEKMDPPLDGSKGSDGVLMFATGDGSSYDKDQRGNIRKKVTA